MTFLDLLKVYSKDKITVRAEFIAHAAERGRILMVDQDYIEWKPIDPPSIPEVIPVDKLCRVRVIQNDSQI